MRNPPPLNPDSPDVEVVAGPVAALLRALYSGKLDAIIDSPLSIPPPVAITWKELRLDCNASWALDAGDLTVELRGTGLSADEQLDESFSVMNHAAQFDLCDGGSLVARLAHLIRRSTQINREERKAMTTYTMSLDSWTWWPTSSALWVGRLDGPRIRDGNLVVCGDGWSTSTCYRLTGNYDLYVIENRKKETTSLIVDTHGTRLDHGLLGTDFVAMEFAVGHPIRLDRVVAFDHDHRLVGAAGLEFGGWTSRAKTGRCPVPETLDLYANCDQASRDHVWIPVLFSLVAKRLQQEGPDSALLIAVSSYLDSIAAGNIHVSYLLVQIALEALSAEIERPKTGVLVADPKKWLAWVEQQRDQISSFATDDEAARKLVNKVRSAQQAPSTDRVMAALEHFGLDVPKEVLKEVARRNSSAHKYVMAKESTADIQELADRLALVQTLLVAIVARHIGFRGPIIGWEWINGRHKIPDWWSWDEMGEARRKYMVLPTDQVALV